MSDSDESGGEEMDDADRIRNQIFNADNDDSMNVRLFIYVHNVVLIKAFLCVTVRFLYKFIYLNIQNLRLKLKVSFKF